ncbi:MAG: hypothetical protein A2X47_08895 [Lentisphaerae bacterium GWF2_38_69]|nr:MAG: hypothetical protein A2X47_08895 [Lentisphaerae bacterium GWF2_38_69]
MATDKKNLKKIRDVFYLRTKVDGKEILKSLGVRTLAEAKTKRDEFLSGARDVKTQSDVIYKVARAKKIYQPKKFLIENIIPEFRTSLETAKSKPGEPLLNMYCYWIKEFQNWLHQNDSPIKYLSEINTDIAKKYAKNLYHSNISPKTYNEKINCLARMFKLINGSVNTPFDEKDESGNTNIERLNKETVSREVFTREDAIRILNSFNEINIPFRNEYELLFYLGAYTGMRLKDCALLLWDKVNFAANNITTRPYKTQKHNIEVQVPMHPNLRAKLITANNPENQYVMQNLAETYLRNPKAVGKVISRILELNGLTNPKVENKKSPCLYGFHSWRYFFSSICAEQGIPLDVVKNLVGHMNEAMTRSYTKISDNKFHQQEIAKFQITEPTPEQDSLKKTLLKRLETLPDSTLSQVLKLLDTIEA